MADGPLDRTLAGALHMTPAMVRLYQQLRAADGAPLDVVARSLGRSPEGLTAEVAPLVEQGAVRLVEGVVRVSEPREALAGLLRQESRALTEAAARLDRLVQAIPTAPLGRPRQVTPGREWVDGEVVVGASVPSLLVPWIEESTGDVLILRPDQWMLPTEPVMFAAVARALHQGRAVRTIYPVRALQEVPQVLTARVAAGEQVRVLPEVPTRLAVVGRDRALFPDPPGISNDRRIVMRHGAVVELLVAYFDALWEKAVPLPALARGTRQAGRRLLLAELAAGSRDEQIARTLGLSLRTVRRRIAEVMIELGADTRFQAGVEAARRGWL
ncbi:DNA-binding response regulator [Nocardioides solisilvae]|uniref:DNA-binding response regulator n=1 Tax=Nocardioides solisilvae TaxID=1542435 RepID=UPI000D743105|nr:DNA-binding response regulator [Nocardioides solisilvae]